MRCRAELSIGQGSEADHGRRRTRNRRRKRQHRQFARGNQRLKFRKQTRGNAAGGGEVLVLLIQQIQRRNFLLQLRGE